MEIAPERRGDAEGAKEPSADTRRVRRLRTAGRGDDEAGTRVRL
jgi:hypothetical protein